MADPIAMTPNQLAASRDNPTTITPPVTTTPTPQIPTTPAVTPDTGTATAYNAAIQAKSTADQKAIDDANAAKAQAQANIGTSTAPKSMSDYLASQGKTDIPTYQTNTENDQIQALTGMTKTEEIAQQQQYTAQIASYQKTIDDATTAKDAAIAAITGRGEVGMDMLNNATAQINRNYNVAVSTPLAEINRVSALSATLAGNVTQAESFTDKMVSAYTQQATNDLNTFENFLSTNNDIISKADTTIQNALTDTVNAQKDALAQQQADLKTKADYYNQAGMSVDVDSLNKMTVAQAIANTSGAIAKQVQLKNTAAQADINKTNADAQKAAIANAGGVVVSNAQQEKLIGSGQFTQAETNGLVDYLAKGGDVNAITGLTDKQKEVLTSSGLGYKAPAQQGISTKINNGLGSVVDWMGQGVNWVKGLFTGKK